MSPSGRRVVTAGETMALLDPAAEGPLAAGAQFSLRVAGAESNFAVALARLGVPVTWVSRLGEDPLGDLIVSTLGAEGIDLGRVARVPAAPTGLFFKWRLKGRSHVLYYRKGSAASTMRPEDIDDGLLKESDLVHLTGITMALGDGCRALVVDAARRAKSFGALVTFDPNYRPPLWEGAPAAAAAHREVLPFIDWYLCGLEEGCELFAVAGSDALFDALEAEGVRNAVIRIGSGGALLRAGEAVTTVAPPRLETVRDEIGAGDGFAAGFVYGLLQGWSPARCAAAGHLIAGSALRGTGDWETFPHLHEVKAELEATAKGRMP